MLFKFAKLDLRFQITLSEHWDTMLPWRAQYASPPRRVGVHPEVTNAYIPLWLACLLNREGTPSIDIQRRKCALKSLFFCFMFWHTTINNPLGRSVSPGCKQLLIVGFMVYQTIFCICFVSNIFSTNNNGSKLNSVVLLADNIGWLGECEFSATARAGPSRAQNG